MISDFNYWSKVGKRTISLAVTFLLIFAIMKLSIFYLPFLIAFVLALFIEPIIKVLMKRLKWTRNLSSVFVMTVSIIILITIIGWGTTTLFNEANNLLKGSDEYYEKIQKILNNYINNKAWMEKLPEELKNAIENSEADLINTLINWITNTLNGIKNWIAKIPNLLITFLFALMSLYFMCTDKIYMIDQLEHHLPDKWTKKLSLYLKEITKKLGHYLKAEATLIFISFFISLVGLTIYKFSGLNIKFPLITALGISFVDALPILGSSAIMIPWAIVEAINGDITLGIAIIVLLAIMAVIRNILEPKLVSKHIGIHPVFTLLAMYTGYKLIGVSGMIVGPIFLIVLKEIYSPLIDKGVLRTIFERGN